MFWIGLLVGCILVVALIWVATKERDVAWGKCEFTHAVANDQVHDLDRWADLAGATFYVCVVVCERELVCPSCVREHVRADGRYQYTCFNADLDTVDYMSSIATRNKAPLTINPN